MEISGLRPLRGVRNMSGKIHAVLFTHPTCVGCGEAYRRLESYSKEHETVEVEVQSLAGEEGKLLAKKWRVNTVPTIIVDDDPDFRIMGVPKPDTLHNLIIEALTRKKGK